MKINRGNFIEVMKTYMAIPSPGGYTHNAISKVKEDFEELGLETLITKKGALMATLKGKNQEEHIMITAHMDTLGAMVKDITPEGRLKYHRIGGGCWSAIEGENCTVITRKGKYIRGSVIPKIASTHIYGQEIANSQRNESNMTIRLDEKVHSKKDVLELGINVGDFIYMDTRTEITESGFIKSRYLDDKAAVAMVLEIARYFKENGLVSEYTTHFFISNYEEMGHGVAMSSIPKQVKEMVAIDIAPVGEGQQSSEYAVTIAAKDRKTVYDFELREKLIDLAEKNAIDYKIDVFNSYSSDATQAIHQGADLKFACVGPGVEGTHHYERTHISSIENNIKLLISYMTSK